MPEQVTQNTYLPEIECEVGDKVGDWGVTVAVQDENQHRQHLSVSQGLITEDAGKNYLSVGVVRVDYPNRRVLVELPQEADSGVGRLWVPFEAFRRGA